MWRAASATFARSLHAGRAVSHLLVVDDHRSIREPLAAYLRRQGFEVTTAADAAAARTWMAATRFDLIILDLMLPGEDGLSLCRFIVDELHTPVIMLTAKAEYSDRIVGLDLGADDYVTKPFSVDELVARVRSVLRRASMPPPGALEDKGQWRFEGWCLDLVHHRLTDPQGVEVPLSTMEFRLLRVFLERPNQVLGRDDLLDLTSRDTDSSPFDRSVDSQVSRLRKKLEKDPRHPVMLKTIWGDGYLFAAEVVRGQP